ncbi:restriction endonuclease [Peribacillus simplex]|uniref:restriction endonuclease n=1 Tax=Peribacillus simplex TaxID=1478 RepID=UPI003D2C3C1B
MRISKVYKTEAARELVEMNENFESAFSEVVFSICKTVWPIGERHFTINNSEKNINGVVPLKERCYIELEETFSWFREKPLDVLKYEKQKGGPIDVYKQYESGEKIGLEFETGNIGSAHRSMNKLIIGVNRGELDLAIILMPVKSLAYFLTDRIANYEELEPYFENTEGKPFIFIGFDATYYDSNVPPIPKGKDGMSKRSIRKWKMLS